MNDASSDGSETNSNQDKDTGQSVATGTRRRRWLVLVLVIIVLLVFVAPPLFFVGAVVLDGVNSRRERQRLLHETDHHALLVASRQLMQEHAGESLAADDPRVPDIIRDLGPTWLEITADRLVVELHGGFDHYGFIAWPDGAIDQERGIELIEGLHFYTE